MRGRSSTDAGRTRPGAAPTVALIALLLLAAAGCRTDPPAVRAAKSALAAFLNDLRAHDEAGLRARAACLVASDAVRDTRLRYMEPPRTVTLGALDSLVARYGSALLEADSLYRGTPDSDPDIEKRFQIVREWGRRSATVRAARRAAKRSLDAAAGAAGESEPALLLTSVRAHVVVQYAGPAVGPDRIERDVVIRLVRAPEGAWIVYAFDQASDPPGPVPF